jgi:peptidoglycan hydrolase-like protein with peptidoglycan-binding domain
VLPGASPAYRDIKPGSSGKDVEQLQAALANLGHDPYEHDGVFGNGTKRALQSFYDSLGYSPLPANDGDDERLDGLRRQVLAAQRGVADAQEAADSVNADPNTTAQQRSTAAKAVSRAQEDLALAQDALAKADRVSGPMLPISEYVFVPTFPVRVDGLKAALGNEVAAPLVTLSVGEPVVAATLTTAQRALCQPGARVEVVGDAGFSATGTVDSIGDAQPPSGRPAPTSQTSDAFIALVVPSPPLDPKHIGDSVRLQIEVAVSNGEQLVVPVTALYAAADGQVYVTKLAGGGKRDRIVVEAGLSAEGYVAVTPKDGGLAVGDQVIVGEATP